MAQAIVRESEPTAAPLMVPEVEAEAAREVEPEAVPEASRPFLWTTDAFQTAGETGIFEGRRVCLIDGEILESMTVGSSHYAAVMKTTRALTRAFGTGFLVRPQGPLNIGQRTDPEPDVAVVTGDIDDYLAAHPTQARLVVEISDATLMEDRRIKASLYARAEIPEYWILNLKQRQLEVWRAPEADPQALYGWSYRDRSVVREDENIAPLSAPDSLVAIADLLP